MKKHHTLLFFALFVSFLTVEAQIDTINIKRLLLNGKVKKIQDFSYILEKNDKGKVSVGGITFEKMPINEDWNIEREATKYSKTNIEYAFDRMGRNTDVVTYYAENQPFGGMSFTYDGSGKIIKSKTIFTMSDGDFVVDKKYFYNEKKRLVKIDEQEGGEWLLTITFKYDDLGNCIERNKVASQSVLEKDIQNYEKKNLILEKKIRPNYTKEKRYSYNKSDKVIFTEEIFPEQNIFLKVQNEYDSEHNLIKTRHINEDNQETICEYKYKKGKLIQSICTATDDPDFYVETNYAYANSKEIEIVKTKKEEVSKKVYEKGLLISHKTPEFEYRYKYTFDKKGNWQEVVMYENDVPSRIRVRKIEYY